MTTFYDSVMTSYDSVTTPHNGNGGNLAPGRAEELPALAAARRLRAWVDHEHDERPTRDELRADVAVVLADRERDRARAQAERGELRERLADARREERTAREASTSYYEDATRLRERLADATRERDESAGDLASLRHHFAAESRELERLRTWGAALIADAEQFRGRLIKAHRERDTWKCRYERAAEARDSARALRDEYHVSYHQAEDERNRLARELATLRNGAQGGDG